MEKIIKPNFFIFGPAAGSTSMYYYLKDHPEIFMSEIKEPLYFRKDLVPRGNLKNRYGSPKEYYKLFQNVNNEKIIGDATPTYIYSDIAIKEIKREIGKPKVIIMLREPVSFIISSHHYAYTNGYENIKDLKQALDAERIRMKSLKNPPIVSEKELTYYSYVLKKIYRNVEKCIKTFGRKNVKIILQSELRKNPEKIYKEILVFLEVNPNFKPKFGKHNIQREVRSRSLMKTIRKVEELPPTIIKLIKISVPKKIRDYIKNSNSQVKSKKQIDPEIKKRIKQEFAKDVTQLGKVTRKNLSSWVN